MGTLKVITSGRGLSFGRHTKRIMTDDGVALEVTGEPESCILAIFTQLDGLKFPFLLFNDGVAEIALMFERKNEKGKWERYDLTKI